MRFKKDDDGNMRVLEEGETLLMTREENSDMPSSLSQGEVNRRSVEGQTIELREIDQVHVVEDNEVIDYIDLHEADVEDESSAK